MIALDDWLRGLGLDRYAAVFAQNDVDFDTLGLLTESDLERLGVSLGHRRMLLRALEERARALESPTGGTAPKAAERRQLAADGERRQLTAFFCDLVNSTELGSRMDPEAWREIIRRYAGICSRAVERFDGHVFQRQGDAIVACFGYPQAHENDPERAIRAALEVLAGMPELSLPDGGRLQARIGIATGLVVVDDIHATDATAVGDTMNLAARLQAVAHPGTIAITDTTRKLAGGAFECEDRGAQALKGIARPVRVWRVVCLARSGSRFSAALRSGLSPLTGREREMAMLLERWELARSGRGQVVLLSGEPGIGKSRLLHALHERLGDEVEHDIRFQCSPFFTNSAFYPVTEWLERELRFLRDEAPAAKVDRLHALMVERHARPVRDVALVSSMLLLPAEDRYGPAPMTPQRQREETIRAVVDMIEAIARSGRTLMLFEDVHWADPTSLEILDLLIRRLAASPLLLLVTHRPSLQKKWPDEPYVSVRALGRLSRGHSADLARGLAGKELPPALLEEIVAKTDGVPLYVEEVTRTLIESQALRDAGDRYEHLDGAGVTIPATLRDSLMERLDRLAADKTIAQIGAVMGREFSHEMLSAVARVPQQELEEAMLRLTQSGLVRRQGTPPDAVYSFKHALIQDAAYDSLLKSSRQQMHRTIAGVLEKRFPAFGETRPELLAHHYAEGGAPAQAVPYFLRAGKNAVARSANLEAIGHLARGIEALKHLPPGPKNDQQELQLQTLLGNALMATRGYGSPEVGRTFDRARELCDRLGETPQLFPVLRGLWMFYLVRSELATASPLAAQLLQLAEPAGDAAVLLEAHRAVGMTSFFAGDFAAGRSHLERGIELYDPVRHRDHAYLYGTDPGVACLCYDAACLWILGFPDRALARLGEGLELAHRCGHAFTRSFALFFAAMVHQWRREAGAAREQADADIALCKEEGFVLWLAMATIVRGWTRFEKGRREEGLNEMRHGLDAYRRTGAGLAHTYSLSLLADAYVKAGRSDEATAVLAEGLNASTRSGERVFEAELHRLQGELAQLSAATAPAAEAHFTRALAIAGEQGAKSFALRAAIGLFRALRAAGRSHEARPVLAAAYAAFDEGFGTEDLQEARALLELRG